jgi:hypothetical protein
MMCAGAHGQGRESLIIIFFACPSYTRVLQSLKKHFEGKQFYSEIIDEVASACQDAGPRPTCEFACPEGLSWKKLFFF